MTESDTESFHSAVDSLSDQEDRNSNDSNSKMEGIDGEKKVRDSESEFDGSNEMQSKCSDKKSRMLEVLPVKVKKPSKNISVSKEQDLCCSSVNVAQFDPGKRINSSQELEISDIPSGEALDYQIFDRSISQRSRTDFGKISKSRSNRFDEDYRNDKKLFEVSKFNGEAVQKFEIDSGKMSRFESKSSEWGALSEDVDNVDSVKIMEEIEPLHEKDGIDRDGWDDWELEYSKEDTNGKRVLDEDQEPARMLTSDDENRITATSKSEPRLKTEAKPNKLFWNWTEFSDVVAAVGEGLTNISSVVESGLGLPTPEELASKQALDRSANDFTEKEEAATSNMKSYGRLFAGFGVNVVTGSLEVLEAIGKKTFEKLTIPEEGSEKRRFIFEPERGQNLSEVLRELRKSRAEEVTLETSCIRKRELTFIDCLEKFGGMFHLEGLEMLSKNHLRKIPPQRKREVDEVFAEDLANTLEEYQDSQRENFVQEFKEILLAIALPYNGTDLTDCYERCEKSLERLPDSSDSIFELYLECLADFTSQSVHSIHKLGQLLLITATRAKQEPFSELHSLIGRQISYLSSEFAQHISAVDTCSEKAEDLGTAVFLAAGDSFSYVQQSFRLLRPLFIL